MSAFEWHETWKNTFLCAYVELVILKCVEIYELNPGKQLVNRA